VPDRLVGDPGRLRQVAINLVGNAIKFTDKGEVVLRVEPEAVADSTVSLHFAISDTGSGIPAEKLQTIFEPFTQADGSATRRHGGTGLGLTISARLVELMGGRLWVESQVGRGSTFHFTASFVRNKQSTPSVRFTCSYPLAGMHVLIVDDNATNRLILTAVLSGWSMKPSAVDSGAAALVELQRMARTGSPYPLVLVDGMMPGMSGFELVGLIKKRPDLGGMTVMMLTSDDVSGHAARCRELGVAAYLIKPIKQAELRRSIEEVLSSKDTIAASVPAVPQPQQAAGPALHFLLAEDNLINQQLAVRFLEKQGHRVTVVGDGREAVAAWQAQPFDMVLMDVQMPEMDGFEATAAIRAAEQGTGRHTTIVALTAHALRGDEQRCLNAGMDGYLSKPIRSQDLAAAIARLAPPPPSSDSLPAAGEPQAEEEVYGLGKALQAAEEDHELLQKMAECFEHQAPVLLEQIRLALQEGNPDAVRRAAHTLKGSAGSLGAKRAWSAAEALEQLKDHGDLARSEDLYRGLADEVERVRIVLVECTHVQA
jgi:two-component system, sensor histidine kinase and response regulator